jgi:hypothetical protein
MLPKGEPACPIQTDNGPQSPSLDLAQVAEHGKGLGTIFSSVDLIVRMLADIKT